MVLNQNLIVKSEGAPTLTTEVIGRKAESPLVKFKYVTVSSDVTPSKTVYLREYCPNLGGYFESVCAFTTVVAVTKIKN